ncbi:hypothetical protein [Jannaschia donghaensis]|uniref:N-acetyltransferase domain-containing protein n=1 Tax=Jannaschia donghaensis TaxID=420998 RepID=A0A0M6YES1_9RHOB|nr:hypothetical protein [Jannaschia donghaensis]CTQ48460.1 hypothetical protein JDO7802_00462 [Jannaschia donghaensis]
MTDFDTLRIGPELAPLSERERAEFIRTAGLLDRGTCPEGFAGHSAVWARDRDLLIGQGAIVELSPDAMPQRARLVPRHMEGRTRVALIDMLAVRPEYRETGLEERIVRSLVTAFAETTPRPAEALIYVGAARAPVLLSTLRGLDMTDEAFR